jgi:hypothetical protein
MSYHLQEVKNLIKEVGNMKINAKIRMTINTNAFSFNSTNVRAYARVNSSDNAMFNVDGNAMAIANTIVATKMNNSSPTLCNLI